jgi:hypothetical protein
MQSLKDGEFLWELIHGQDKTGKPLYALYAPYTPLTAAHNTMTAKNSTVIITHCTMTALQHS